MRTEPKSANISIDAVVALMPKKSFYRSANAIFGKVGRAANEEVVVQLLVSKCIPMLMYGLEACSLIKSQLLSLDFAVNRFFNETF